MDWGGGERGDRGTGGQGPVERRTGPPGGVGEWRTRHTDATVPDPESKVPFERRLNVVVDI